MTKLSTTGSGQLYLPADVFAFCDARLQVVDRSGAIALGPERLERRQKGMSNKNNEKMKLYVPLDHTRTDPLSP